MAIHLAGSRSVKQQEILDKTLELVRKNGLAGLTTKKIAEKVGFTEAALYRHFPTKNALINGLIDRLEDMLIGPIREIAGDREVPVEVRLERILSHHAKLVYEQNSLPILLLAEATASGDPELLGRMRSILHEYLSVLEGLIREVQTGGSVDKTPKEDCLSLVLLGAPAALAIRHRLLPDRRLERRFIETLIPYLIETLLLRKGDN